MDYIVSNNADDADDAIECYYAVEDDCGFSESAATTTIESSESESECKHLETMTTDSGNIVCCNCGLQLKETLVDTEQRYYTPGDSTNQSRHHTKKSEARSLFGDLEKHSFPKPVAELSNTYYTQLIDGHIYRAKTRTAIVFACVFNAFKALKEPRSPEEIARAFDLDKKGISRGLKRFSSFFKGSMSHDHINALHLIPKLLSELNITNPLVFEDLTKIYNFVIKRSSLYKSSAPQSVAAGLIWFYLKKAKIDVPKQRFAQVVGLTDITYTKLADDTARCLDGK